MVALEPLEYKGGFDKLIRLVGVCTACIRLFFPFYSLIFRRKSILVDLLEKVTNFGIWGYVALDGSRCIGLAVPGSSRQSMAPK
jgi:hypothetical protein